MSRNEAKLDAGLVDCSDDDFMDLAGESDDEISSKTDPTKNNGINNGINKGIKNGINKGIKNATSKVILPTLNELPEALRTEQEWAELLLSRPLLKALNDLHFAHPTPIQVEAIPPALEGHDVLMSAETGSGKTLAFLLPCLERLLQAPHVRCRSINPRTGEIRGFAGRGMTKVLVLLPSRELATQCFDNLKALAKYCPISTGLASGGSERVKTEQQMRLAPDAVVATPGRCLDLLLNTQGVHFNLLDIVVFDEADKLLDLGFRDVCLQVLKRCSPTRQTILCSATLSSKARELADIAMKSPVWVPAKKAGKGGEAADNSVESVANKMQQIVQTVSHRVVKVPDPKIYRFASAIYVIAKEHQKLYETIHAQSAQSAQAAGAQGTDAAAAESAQTKGLHSKGNFKGPNAKGPNFKGPNAKGRYMKGAQINPKDEDSSDEETTATERSGSGMKGSGTKGSGTKGTDPSQTPLAGTKIIVFFNTKKHARLFALILREIIDKLPKVTGYEHFPTDFAELHSLLSVGARAEQYRKLPTVDLIVATDVAGRGLDIGGIGGVINVDLPQEGVRLIHRIGRTGRAGASGRAVTFYHPETHREIMRSVWKETRQSPEMIRNAAVIPKDDKLLQKIHWLVHTVKSDINKCFAAENMEKVLHRQIADAEEALHQKKNARSIDAIPERQWIEPSAETKMARAKKRRRTQQRF